MTISTFESLHLHPALLEAVNQQGYTQPTPIQLKAIPIVMAGRDLMAGAQTGTGKTAAFTLPLLHWLNEHPRQSSSKSVRILVLTPTRELAAQVESSVRTYGQNLKVRSVVIFGGVNQGQQANAIKQGVDVLVATPGRLLDLLEQGLVDLSHVEKLVLDEADRMLDMGFINDVKKVLAKLPKSKQCLLFSATFGDDVVDLARSLLQNPEHIQVTPKNTTVERISQISYLVGRKKKTDLLAHLINHRQWTQVLVFTRTKHSANKIAESLDSQGIQAVSFHGNKSQPSRTRAMNDFRAGKIRALIATDIMARGIDIDSLPHVVNYDIPNNCEDYVHRIGRTGRAGADGEAVNFVSLDEQGFMVAIEKFTHQSIPQGKMIDDLSAFSPASDEIAEPIAMGRQTLWGGLGRAPSQEVMAQASRRARQEMSDRMRDKRQQPPRRPSNAPSSTGARPQPSQGMRSQPPRSSTPREASDGQNEAQPRHHGNPAFAEKPANGYRSHQSHPRSDSSRGDRPSFGNKPHQGKRNQGGEHYTGVSSYRRVDDSILGAILPPEKKAERSATSPHHGKSHSAERNSSPQASSPRDEHAPRPPRPHGGFLTRK